MTATEKKDKRVILPMAEPLLSSYPEEANLLSIIQNCENSYQWIYNNFIHMYISPATIDAPHMPFFTEHYSYCCCPFVNSQVIDSQHIRENSNIHVFLQNCIMNDGYVLVWINQKYLKCSGRDEDFMHLTMFFGFDLDEELYFVADNFGNGKYTRAVAAFSEIENAFLSNYVPMRVFPNMDYYLDKYGCFSKVVVLQLTPDAIYTFNKKALKISIQDYLDQKNIFLLRGAPEVGIIEHENLSWGIGVYDGIIEGVRLKVGKPINVHGIHAELQHKLLLRARIIYLDENSPLLDKVDRLISQLKKVLVLLLMYNARKKYDNVSDIVHSLQIIKNNEHELLSEMINAL